MNAQAVYSLIEHRLSGRSPPPLSLPDDPGSAAALVSAIALAGTDSVDRGAAISAMRGRVAELLRPDSDAVFEELAAHAVVLDSLAMRWGRSALAARNAEDAATFNKMAVACSTAHTRTLIAVEGLRAQRKGRGAVTLPHDDDSDPDDAHDSDGDSGWRPGPAE